MCQQPSHSICASLRRIGGILTRTSRSFGLPLIFTVNRYSLKRQTYVWRLREDTTAASLLVTIYSRRHSFRLESHVQ